jgi:hypothetical protein
VRIIHAKQNFPLNHGVSTSGITVERVNFTRKCGKLTQAASRSGFIGAGRREHFAPWKREYERQAGRDPAK